jgi:two-component system, response regulator / RNA-binding antiterminator
MEAVLLLEESRLHPRLRAALCELGYDVVSQFHEIHRLHADVTRLSPDVIMVTTDAPSEELLVSLGSIAGSCPRTVIIIAKDGTRDLIRRAVDSGVSAYVVDPSAADRLTPIIEAAIARFEAFEAMRKELAGTRATLAERKLVEKAKGIVMQQRKLSEDQAYGALRKMAMDQNLALAEVARRVIAVAQLLG